MTAIPQENPINALSYDAIVQALFETYECLYDIDAETSAYQCYHESESFSAFRLASSGSDFFRDLIVNIPYTVYFEDQEYLRTMLRRDTVLRSLERERYYIVVYRLMMDGQPVYHKIRATMEPVNGRPHILLGVRRIDETIRREKAHTEALASMHQKERNHMEAVLASAEGYIEVNLTRDLVLDKSPLAARGGMSMVEVPLQGAPLRYSDFNRWIIDHQLIDNAARYARISSRDYLMNCFSQGDRRASVSFSVRLASGGNQPCREVFYLYQDDASGDILSFCVIYDLTEQQRKEKELRDLENELRMSRIRNFTSQMQPHFLYNALGSIQEIMLEDPEYASELIGDFTIHLRSCIRAMANDAPLPFDQELDNIRAYVNIEKMRFGKKLKIVYDIETDRFSILPLSIQPLVENAIRHGVYERGPRGGTVTIRTREGPDAFTVEVEDDGVGFDYPAFLAESASGKRDSTGLKNIIFRLDKVMRTQVEVSSVIGSGTRITVTIPKGGNDQ